eukprot:TRINITY_DN12716_c0_g1_i2.p1 TRINITY_DN12716_c0_g1~~TRINITY_DN12716_c0_g1_i2.p1  ORF type:complete len:158 (+),score=39.68 TRINITY_DN12716_c0_g1_i2:71-475(+)
MQAVTSGTPEGAAAPAGALAALVPAMGPIGAALQGAASRASKNSGPYGDPTPVELALRPVMGVSGAAGAMAATAGEVRRDVLRKQLVVDSRRFVHKAAPRRSSGEWATVAAAPAKQPWLWAQPAIAPAGSHHRH